MIRSVKSPRRARIEALSQPRPVRVAQYGLGPIGIETTRAVLAPRRDGLVQLVAALDIHPDLVGRRLADLLGPGVTTEVVVSGDVESTLRESGPDVVLHTTGSFLEQTCSQIEQCVRAGAHLVSSSEELFYPFDRHPQLAGRLDGLARENGVVILGTGVNPGFVMDTLALVATGACDRVDRLEIERVVDASKRRLPLQRKVGAGLTIEEFEERKRAGKLGHIGLRESMLFVARGLGWAPDRIDEQLDAVVADHEIVTPHVKVAPGEVAGIHQRVTGEVAGTEVIALDLRIYVGAPDPRDAVRVEGDPPVDLVIRRGLFGDTATVAALINAIPLVLSGEPGLRTMMDLRLPRCFGARTPGRADA